MRREAGRIDTGTRRTDAPAACACCGAGAGPAGSPAGSERPARGRDRGRLAAGAALLAIACALPAAASTAPALVVWPLAFGVAWLGMFEAVSSAGCGMATTTRPTVSQPMSAPARRRRVRWAGRALAAAAVPAVLALAGLSFLWPLAFVGAWMGISFGVAAATGYPGCPELGAIPSLLARRHVATRCPPLE